MNDLSGYPFELRPLTVDEGGGFLISYPDFSECIADGETVEETIANGRAALAATIATLAARGFPVPAPSSGGVASGKFVARVPKSIHAQLAVRAKAEGVSLNTLVLTFIAEGLGRRAERHSALP
jgi:antitoxin HicB